MFQLELQTPGFHPSIIPLDVGIHRIGRNPGNDHCLDDPTVSGHHCTVQVASDRVVIQDLQSTNGTYIDGRRIQSPEALMLGQILRLGTVEMKLAPEARVAIPDLPPVEELNPTLADGVRACPNHRSVAATFECTKCQKVFCELCVHQVRLAGGKGHTLCPSCSGPCEAIAVVTASPPRKGALATWISKVTVALTTRPPRTGK